MIYVCDGKTTTVGEVFEFSRKDDEDPESNSNDELCSVKGEKLSSTKMHYLQLQQMKLISSCFYIIM